MTDDFVPITPELEVQTQVDFHLPSRFQGIVALVEKDRVFVADIRVKDSRPKIAHIGEGRIEPRDDESDTFAEEMSYALAEVLETCNFPRNDLIIAVPNSLFSMDILTLPAVNHKNMKTLIQRKMQRSGMGAGEAWSYEILEDKRKEPEGGVRVLIARTRASWIHKFHDQLERFKIKPARITVSLSGVIQLMRHMDPKEGESLLAIEVSSGDAVLAIFMNRRLNQIRILKDGVNTDRERFNYILLVELQRTQAFHMGKFKGRSIKKALVLGSHSGCVDIDRVTLPIELASTSFGASEGDDLTERESQTEEGILALMTGLLITSERRKAAQPCLDFTPPKKRTALIAASLATVMICALAGVAVLSNHMERESNRLALELNRLEAELRPFDTLVQKRRHLRAVDGYYRTLDALFEDLRRERRNVAEGLLAVREHMPERAALKSIDYLASASAGRGPYGNDRIVIQFEGDFTGAGSRELLEFIEELNATDLFLDTRFRMSGAVRSPSAEGGMKELVYLELYLK